MFYWIKSTNCGAETFHINEYTHRSRKIKNMILIFPFIDRPSQRTGPNSKEFDCDERNPSEK